VVQCAQCHGHEISLWRVSKNCSFRCFSELCWHAIIVTCIWHTSLCFLDSRFAAALRDLNIWVMNVVPVDSPDTLPIIFERGLFGIYHDWCESFSTYPRSYDLLHADHLFSKLKKRC
jgi:hypothetical protein